MLDDVPKYRRKRFADNYLDGFATEFRDNPLSTTRYTPRRLLISQTNPDVGRRNPELRTQTSGPRHARR
jgi:hypothetical protein